MSWNHAALWANARVPQRLQVADLRRHFDLPEWHAGDDGRFQVRPVDVVLDPDCIPDQNQRILDSDLEIPIYVIRRRGHWQILDGIHRTAKADLLGLDEIAAVQIHFEGLASLAGTA